MEDVRFVVLVVEDMSELRQLCRRMIESQFPRAVILETGNGLQAIEVYHNASVKAGSALGGVDIVLTANVMPTISGPALACHLVRTGHDPRRIILMSGSLLDPIAIHGSNEGSMVRISLLRKPFPPRELTSAISEALKA